MVDVRIFNQTFCNCIFVSLTIFVITVLTHLVLTTWNKKKVYNVIGYYGQFSNYNIFYELIYIPVKFNA